MDVSFEADRSGLHSPVKSSFVDQVDRIDMTDIAPYRIRNFDLSNGNPNNDDLWTEVEGEPKRNGVGGIAEVNLDQIAPTTSIFGGDKSTWNSATPVLKQKESFAQSNSLGVPFSSPPSAFPSASLPSASPSARPKSKDAFSSVTNLVHHTPILTKKLMVEVPPQQGQKSQTMATHQRNVPVATVDLGSGKKSKIMKVGVTKK